MRGSFFPSARDFLNREFFFFQRQKTRAIWIYPQTAVIQSRRSISIRRLQSVVKIPFVKN